MKYPKAWSVKAKSEGIKSSKLEAKAKLDMSERVLGNGLCPVTGKPMEKMMVNGHEVWVSLGERIALPIKD